MNFILCDMERIDRLGADKLYNPTYFKRIPLSYCIEDRLWGMAGGIKEVCEEAIAIVQVRSDSLANGNGLGIDDNQS